MAKSKEEKTNVMRVLENAGVPFTEHRYDPAITDGERVAAAVGTDPDATCKTLVTVAASKKHYAFVLPVNRELDLKACARLAGEKSVAMLPQKDLFPLTGYIHGGCSPIGMKKSLPTFFEDCVLDFEAVTLSAGKVGVQVTVEPKALVSLCRAGTGSFSRPKA